MSTQEGNRPQTISSQSFYSAVSPSSGAVNITERDRSRSLKTEEDAADDNRDQAENLDENYEYSREHELDNEGHVNENINDIDNENEMDVDAETSNATDTRLSQETDDRPIVDEGGGHASQIKQQDEPKAKKQKTIPKVTISIKPKSKRGGSKPILKTSGIAKITDTSLKSTLFAPLVPINQKNYSTDYLKKDEQALVLRGNKEAEERDTIPEKTVVIHPGSRNLRIGLASDTVSKTIPFVIAHRKIGSLEVEGGKPHSNDSDAFEQAYSEVYKDFRERMRYYKRRVVANSREIVTSYNESTQPEVVPAHSDLNEPDLIENDGKSNVPKNSSKFTQSYIGEDALRLANYSDYRLFWPIKNGVFNEDDYQSPEQLLGDFRTILVHVLATKLSINLSDLKEYNVVLLIPDLYDKTYVLRIIQLLLCDMGFGGLCVQQEAVAATFGAGISTACIIDVGAQKTSISCVEEGISIGDSRVLLRYGGDDVTRSLIQLFERSSFPYREIDIQHNVFDWKLAEQLKAKFATTNDADVAIQLYNFYARTPGKPTRRYQFKTFEEVMLAPLGYFYPQLFMGLDSKMQNRHKLFIRSADTYDAKNNDPVSDAQINVYLNTLHVNGQSYTRDERLKTLQEEDKRDKDTKSEKDKETAKDREKENGKDKEKTISEKEKEGGIKEKLKGVSKSVSSVPGTPAPPETAQARAAAHSAAVASQLALQSFANDTIPPTKVPTIGLEKAIIESITQGAAKSVTGASRETFYESVMVVGGGAKFPGFSVLLADRIGMWRNHSEIEPVPGEISIMPPPREMDPEQVVWKGGSVLAKLKIVNELWINAFEWEMVGPRALQYKALFLY